MTKNAKTLYLTLIGSAILIFLVLVGRDILLRGRSLDCGDGPRHTIDIRQFETQYSAYSVELEASIAKKGQISAKLDPVQLQQLSEVTQNAREFRKYVVAGYNSCALTKAQYGQYGARFQALDNLAREINEMVSKPSLPQQEATRLAELIKQYGDMVKSVSSG